ncbi:hypothetical protein GPX89_26980 [Nocardia sp. ET3-3]|uniref:Glycine zipper family protein n=1 Tax=Nocardia terrae TaxID=2675851 RepID=A0A7K1V308_9NOCA|nr:hypothetical protein [Nocardia terrae]MVU80882.1 hypothetical protein [Nocardia terrae]
MSDLRGYAVLAAVPVIFAFGSGTAGAQPAEFGQPAADRLSPTETPGAIADPDPHSLRLGTATVPLPEGIDPLLRDQAQVYADGVQQQITTALDGAGIPRGEADRRIAATVGGAVIGAAVGKVAVFPLEIVGCGVGAVVGAVAGGVIGGLPTVGAGAPVGAAVGGVAGCLLGGLAVAIPVDVIGLVGGAVIGGAAGGALSTGGDVSLPDTDPSLVNAPAPQADPPALEPAAEMAEAATAISPDADAAVTSLRSAIATMPPLAPSALGMLTQPANDLLAAVQAAL